MVAIGVLLIGGTSWSSGARTSGHALQGTAQVGDLELVAETAEVRSVLDLPSGPLEPAGQWIVVYLAVTNHGNRTFAYDDCPPDGGSACFGPSWFVAVDEGRGSYPSDPDAASALGLTGETLPFGEVIEPGDTGRIALAFDVPTDVTIWALMAGAGAPGDFALEIAPVEITRVGMNEVVSLDAVDLTATRALLRSQYGEQPNVEVAEGVFLTVVLRVEATGSAPVEYDICPEGETVCVSPYWFEVADGEGNRYEFDTVTVTQAVPETEGTLGLGPAIEPGSPAEIAIVFDVPSGESDWSLLSTADAPGAFAISLEITEVATDTDTEIEGVETFEGLSQEHAEGPIDYPQDPPVGGPHAEEWQSCGFYDEPVGNENAVHSLEHGAIWITYQPDLPADQVDILRDLAEQSDYILVSPYPDLPAPVVATAWGKQLRLDSADDPRLQQFIQAYIEQGPGTQAAPMASRPPAP
jgi:hypothetical protein